MSDEKKASTPEIRYYAEDLRTLRESVEIAKAAKTGQNGLSPQAFASQFGNPFQSVETPSSRTGVQAQQSSSETPSQTNQLTTRTTDPSE